MHPSSESPVHVIKFLAAYNPNVLRCNLHHQSLIIGSATNNIWSRAKSVTVNSHCYCIVVVSHFWYEAIAYNPIRHGSRGILVQAVICKLMWQNLHSVFDSTENLNRSGRWREFHLCLKEHIVWSRSKGGKLALPQATSDFNIAVSINTRNKTAGNYLFYFVPFVFRIRSDIIRFEHSRTLALTL